ncbi:MAG: NAD(P)H-hydrate dehydratase [Muribaculaceae bacterium]|nr:NAD(P)H-hydrate dehydratase [Muribaculaceae bacterium]
MKIFTTEGIRRIDQQTIEEEGISRLELMERAASAVAYEIMSRWLPSKRIVIFAGPGDNGGDALAAARMLYEQGYHPEVYLFNIKSSHLSACCSTNRDLILKMEGVDFVEIVDTFNPPDLDRNDLVIDGLFGSGLRSPLKGGYQALVQYINESEAFVVSIDVPSGLFGEWNLGSDPRNIIQADLTLTFQFKRLAFFFAENAQFVGECKVLDLDLSENAISKTPTDFYLIEESDVRGILKPHSPFINKYDNGTVFLVAGSYGMMGAAILSARGATRAGAGLVTVHAPRCGFSPLMAAAPEVLFEGDRNEIFTTNIELHHKYSVVALGPGMGIADETLDAVDTFIKNYRMPCILDADALNCIALRPMLLRSIPKGSILTPHDAEFDRLFGLHHSDEERLKKAIDVSKLYEITIVLKGHHTMTVRPDGKVYINSSGNAGMATAGSGDVLTGVIAAFIAQGYAPDWGVVLGVYVHGKAGDIAVEEQGTYGLIAGDIANHVGKAIKYIMRPLPSPGYNDAF